MDKNLATYRVGIAKGELDAQKKLSAETKKILCFLRSVLSFAWGVAELYRSVSISFSLTVKGNRLTVF